MSIENLQDTITDEIKTIISSEFDINLSKTTQVPTVDDYNITYPNFDLKQQDCKQIETSILYIDIRSSTLMNIKHRPETLVKLYSAFIRTMSTCAEYFGGKVRGIVGDRLMVVFDEEASSLYAVETAVLMNTARIILNRAFPHNNVHCGIGLDYGLMTVAKTGKIKRGKETSTSKALVWLGKPANIASKLTDQAAKTHSENKQIIREMHKIPTPNMSGLLGLGLARQLGSSTNQEYIWKDVQVADFLNKLDKKYTLNSSTILTHPDNSFSSFIIANETVEYRTPPILTTGRIIQQFRKYADANLKIKRKWITQKITVPGLSGSVYGCNDTDPVIRKNIGQIVRQLK